MGSLFMSDNTIQDGETSSQHVVIDVVIYGSDIEMTKKPWQVVRQSVKAGVGDWVFAIAN
jgi:hypothetical protein